VVPALLGLRNFLCYRDNCPPLDFSGIHVACLTGENGNGKSALLDAMTWALWGQARARSDDELIHLGRTEMEVEFEFYVGEQRYRVIRKRKKGTQRSPGTTALEFHIATPNGWKPLTANHVRETERAIRNVLKLDYETFINSAFLIQGRADEFTLKTPGDRKRILAEILGLGIYDELEQEARYEMKLHDDQVRSLDRDLTNLGGWLAQEPEYQAQRGQITAALEVTERELLREGALLESLKQAERLLALQRQQAEQAERRRSEAAGEVDRAAQTVARHQREIEAHQAVLIDAEAIRDGFRRLLDARALGKEYERRAHALTDLQRRHDALQTTIEQARLRLVSEEQTLAAEVKRLTDAAAPRQDLERGHAELEERLAALTADEAHVQALRQEEQEHREVISALRSQNDRLRDEMTAIKQKQTELADTTICPLCRTELGHDGQAHIVQAYEAQGHEAAAQYRQNRARMQEREANAAGLHSEIERREQETRERRARLSRQAGTQERRLQEAREAEARLPEREAALQDLRDRIAAGGYASEQTAQRDAIAQEIDALGYDRAAHDAARARIEACLEFEKRQQQLELAEARLESEQRALASAESVLQDWQARLAERSAEAEQLCAALATQPDPRGRREEAQTAWDARSADQRRLRQSLGAVEQKLDDCRGWQEQQTLKSAAHKLAAQERQLYEQLAVAFSKRGVQALIIDHVLPEITEETNRLLGRMTNNRLQVMLDTQRQTQKGSVTETLDIRISDELGTRNYELFSGGEAFRVNLALRIALSKLLARRAGAPLPTLVIDEGFGSQDAAARERLIEAINVIQADFQCLLIITHIEELKDQFPVHIEVVKTPEGSIAGVVS
jgi:exonuclease SbcC